MSLIIGINSFHGDSSACILRDGVLIAAAEEERFRRVKHWAGFPSESIRFCLSAAEASLEQVTHLAVNHDRRANLGRKILSLARYRPSLEVIADRIRNGRMRLSVKDQISANFPGKYYTGNLHQVEHHLSHMASAFYTSPFPEAVAVSIDGFGDFASTAWGIGSGTSITVQDKVYFPHSLGIFYQALTQFLGFPNYGDEYKVMGLAPYGEPTLMPEMRKIVKCFATGKFELDLSYFRHHREKVTYEWNGGPPVVGDLFSGKMADLLGTPRSQQEPLTQFHKNIASSVQAMFEEAFFNLLNCLYSRYKIDSVTISGGCGMNSVANGKIRLKTPFRNVYVQAAPGDAGCAVGAALAVWHKVGGNGSGIRGPIHEHAYWGPWFTSDDIKEDLCTLKEELQEQGCSVIKITDTNLLCAKTAKFISDGLVIGWFQGRMEWGPRALGNRSIVCDPRRADMKEILNRKIKRRESFRPFAPSVLADAVGDWFEQDDGVPFMTQVYQIRPGKRSLIPAVTHVDGSGRLQTVHQHTNPRYFSLISAFRDLTGIPMVLNTSFNENEPVVCNPKQALDCFLRTKMDVLVMGDWLVQRA